MSGRPPAASPASAIFGRWPIPASSAIRRPCAGDAGYEFMVSTHHVNLTPQENSLIAESDPEALARMDEKQLKELRSRLRQAREKNFSLLRRRGAAGVEAEGARGAAQPAD